MFFSYNILIQAKISCEIPPEIEKKWIEEKKKWDNFKKNRATSISFNNSENNNKDKIKLSEVSGKY
jgi:hypothetical protein